uniref:Retrotransposon gag domain-containing protein n=1 Tax=Vitis vinifera TaxID=29760 RepID=A5B1J3_VITVI|nr:hypothetical protein VITISV_014181 [Vitis vinifera]
MLSTPFNPHIINYNLQGGFMVLKFSTYDGTKDPFDHIMHYKQLMTLDIGNDALLCKVFPASLQGQALSWFHRLPMNSVNNFQELSQRRQVDRERGGQQQSNQASLTPLNISYEKLIPMIRKLSNFKWSEPIKMIPAKRDWGRKCVYHNDYGHTTEQCRSLHYLVEKAIINYIHGGPVDEKYNSKRKKQMFELSPYESKLAPSNLMFAFKQMGFPPSALENLGRILSGFNGASTTFLRDVVLPFSMVEDLSFFNAIMGRTWLHGIKVIPSTYHQMVSYLTEDGQINLYGSQLATCQSIEITKPEGKRSIRGRPLADIHLLEESDHFTYASSLLTLENVQALEGVLR